MDGPARKGRALFVAVRGVNHNPPGVEPWRVEIKKVEAEWQAPQPILNKTYSTTKWGVSGSFSSGKRTLYAQTEVYPLPCAQAQRVARVHALLTRYQQFTETATFRDLPLRPVRGGLQFALPKPRTVTTRAGVRLVLSSDTLGNSFFGGPQNVVFRLRVEPAEANDKGVRLPASPLFRRYKKPVRVSAQADWDEVHIAGRFYSSDGDQGVRLHYVPASGRLDALSFTVTQEVALETVPLTFTVPVAKVRPKADWGR